MDSFSAIIDRWHARAAFARDLAATYGAAQLVRRRDSIFARRRGRRVKEARRIEGVTLDALAAKAAAEPSRLELDDQPGTPSRETYVRKAAR